MPKLDQEDRVTLKKLTERGCSNTEVARILGVTEGAVRYHVRRLKQGAKDGRCRSRSLAEGFRDRIEAWIEARDSAGINLAELYDYLVSECSYPGSLRSIQRYVETLPEAQEACPAPGRDPTWRSVPGGLGGVP